MRFVDTLRPLIWASLFTTVLWLTVPAFLVSERFSSSYSVLNFSFVALYGGIIWGLMLVALTLFVVPVFVLMPKLRQPPLWVAATWGIALQWMFAMMIVGKMWWLADHRPSDVAN